VTPEEALFSAVIEQAIEDASGNVNCALQEVERNQAHLFLTARTGPWAEARETWCDAIGMDPDVLRQHVLAIIPEPGMRRDGTRAPAPPPRAGSVPALIMDVLEREALTTPEIAQRIGRDPKSLSHTLSEMKAKGLICRAGPKQYSVWSVPSSLVENAA